MKKCQEPNVIPKTLTSLSGWMLTIFAGTGEILEREVKWRRSKQVPLGRLETAYGLSYNQS